MGATVAAPGFNGFSKKLLGTESGDGGILCVVQLLLGPPDATSEARDGSGLDGSRLDRP